MRITMQQLREKIAAGEIAVYKMNNSQEPSEMDEETRWWWEGSTATMKRLDHKEWLDRQRTASGVSRR